MNRLPVIILAGLTLVGFSACQSEACNCAASESTPTAKTHPLKGVVTDILPDKSALLVKHEAIPGVMAAMTMLFQVDAATLSSAKKGQPITAQMSKRDDGWWLTDVKPVSPATP
jgi:Cu/Ag efflux protein CusF